jgi:4a-hydroxytetrahydrobiopterin dehydratase
MPRPPRLTDDEIDRALRDLPGWERRDDTLHREFEFEDFSRAFGFMAACATVAQALDHHPDWSNVYSTVVVTLSTHDAGGLTELDVQLATKMSQFAG